MTGSGGWPLNVIALPDGRPIWGGTYFKKEHWLNALTQIQETYLDQPEKLVEYATKLEEGIKTGEAYKGKSGDGQFEYKKSTDYNILASDKDRDLANIILDRFNDVLSNNNLETTHSVVSFINNFNINLCIKNYDD